MLERATCAAWLIVTSFVVVGVRPGLWIGDCGGVRFAGLAGAPRAECGNVPDGPWWGWSNEERACGPPGFAILTFEDIEWDPQTETLVAERVPFEMLFNIKYCTVRPQEDNGEREDGDNGEAESASSDP